MNLPQQEVGVCEPLVRKCGAAGLSTVITEDEYFGQRLVIEVPGDPQPERITVNSPDVDLGLGANFESYRFLADYDGIWSRTLGFVEVTLRAASPVGLRRMRAGLGLGDSDDPVVLPVDGTELRVQIGAPTPEFQFMNDRIPRTTMRLGPIQVDTVAEASDILVMVAHSTFVLLDDLFGTPFYLGERTKFMALGGRRQLRAREAAIRFAYATEPAILYMHGKMSLSSPILRYLSYYQGLEYFFPVYAQRDTIEAAKTKLKDPRFNVDRDEDVLRLFRSVNKNRDDERAQLRLLLAKGTDLSDVKEYVFSGDKDRRTFFKGSKEARVVSSHMLTEGTEFLNSLVARIYDIRCKIVHTKASDEDDGVILPYSSAARLLRFDINLVEYILHAILVRESKPIHLR